MQPDFRFSKGLAHSEETGLPIGDDVYPTEGTGDQWSSLIPLVEPGSEGEITSPAPEPLDELSLLNLYWMALIRDVPFNSYDTDEHVAEAKAEIARFSGVEGFDLTDWSFAPGRWHYPESSASRRGHYVSQLLMDEPPGPYEGHHLVDDTEGENFGATALEVAQMQMKGRCERELPTRLGRVPVSRSGRSLGYSVRNDWTSQHWVNAYLVLAGFGVPTEWHPGTDHAKWTRGGVPHVVNGITASMLAGMSIGFPTKWRHCRLRPMQLAARLNDQIKNNTEWGFSDLLINSQAVRMTGQLQGNYFLSQATPESHPAHPAYPAGHACCAGAGATILRSVFPDVQYPSPTGMNNNLSTHGEIVKLAMNECAGRMWLGIHYDSDNWLGLRLGEDSAREWLIANDLPDPGTVFAVDSAPVAS